ncbi:MAG: outer membrane beta-barrel protein [Acidobacteriota bacterium]
MASSVIRRQFWAALLAGMLLAPTAAAQGPLTSNLSEGELPVAAYRIGPVSLNPQMAVREIGVDTNVFSDPENPQRDWVVSISPGMDGHVRSGILQFVFSSGTDFTYYAKFKSERAAMRQFMGRLDFLLARLRPSIGYAANSTRTKPNAEIDLRARRREGEVSARIAFEVSPLARVAVSAARVETRFDDGEVYRGIDLARSLNRRAESATLALRLQLTPFTTLTLDGSASRDEFLAAAGRDSESRLGGIELDFSRDAIITGRARVGYRDFRPEDPTLAPYRGLTSSVGLSVTTFWRGRFDATFERDVQYSFEEAEGYFVSNGLDFTYTQRLFGPIDVQSRVGRGMLEYSERAGIPGRQDELLLLSGGLGYNRNSGARFGVNYEYSDRESADRADRRFVRRRIYGSYEYRF